MKNSFRLGLSLFILMFLLIWSGGSVTDVAAVTTGEISVTGTATYRERMMIPPDAVFKATVLDITRADVASAELGKVILTKLPAPPINFSILVDPARIDQHKVYAVRAQILVGERLIFTSDSVYPVLTRGAENRVDIILKKVSGKGRVQRDNKPDAPVVNTYWKVVTLEGEKIPPATGKKEPHLLLKNVDKEHRFVATVGCNQLIGGFSLTGEKIRFTAPMTTMMACPPALDVWEKHLSKVLLRTTGWHVTGDTLELLDDNGSSIALFEAVYF